MKPLRLQVDEFEVLCDWSREFNNQDKDKDTRPVFVAGVFNTQGIIYQDKGREHFLLHANNRKSLRRAESMLRAHKLHGV